MKNTNTFSQAPEQGKKTEDSEYSEIQVKKEEDLSNSYLEETQSIMNHGKQDPEYRDYKFLDPLTYHEIFSVEKSPYLEQINVAGDGLIYSKQASSPILRGTIIGPALAIEYTEEFLKRLYGENIDLVDLQYSLPAQPVEEENAEKSSEIARSSQENDATAKENRSQKIRLPTENMLQFAREKKVGLCPVYFVNHRSNVLIQLGFSPIGVAPEKIQKYLAGSREGYILYKKTVYSVVNGKVHVLKNNVSKRIQEIFPPVMTENEDIKIEALPIDVLYKDEFDLLECLNPSASVPKRHNVEYDLMEYPPGSKKYLTIWVSVDDIYPGDEITTSYGADAQKDFQTAPPNSKRSLIFDLENEAMPRFPIKKTTPRFTIKIEDKSEDVMPDTRILEHTNIDDSSENIIFDHSENEENDEIKEHYLFIQESEEFTRSLIKELNGEFPFIKLKRLFSLPENKFKMLLLCFENQSELCKAFNLNGSQFAAEKKVYPEKYKLLIDKNNFKGKYFTLAAKISKKASEDFSADHQSAELVNYVNEALKTFSKEIDKIKCFMSLSPKIVKRVTQSCSNKSDLCKRIGIILNSLSNLKDDFPQNYEIINDKANFKLTFIEISKPKSLSTLIVDILFESLSAIPLSKKRIIHRLTAGMQGYSEPATPVKELLSAKEENFRVLLKFFDNKDDFVKSLGVNRRVYDDIVNSPDCTLVQQINYNLLKDKNNFKLHEQQGAPDLSFLNRSSGEALIKNLQQNVATYLKSNKRMTATEKIKYFFGLFKANEGKFAELLAQFDSPMQLLRAFSLSSSKAMDAVQTAAPRMHELMIHGVFGHADNSKQTKDNDPDLDLSLADPHKRSNIK